MHIQQLVRTDPERILMVVRNVDGGGSITTGMGAQLFVAAASINGNAVTKNTQATAEAFCGVAAQDIAINAWGLVTAWGWAASVFISQSVGSWTITAGDILKHGGQAGTFTSVITDQAVSTLYYKYIIAAGGLADTISNPRPYVSGIVRAL